MDKIFIILSLVLADISFLESSKTYISVNDKRITYEGRIKFVSPQEAEIFWPGTSIKINFKGTGVDAILKDEKSDNFYTIIIDGDSLFKLNPDTLRSTYTLAKDLAFGEHTVEIFKRTSWDKGRAWFYGFELPEGTKILPASPKKKRKMEFYGDSITTGYAIEDTKVRESPAGKFENNYLTYSTLTARHFNAQNSCIAKAGIGITISYFPLIMPQMFSRLDPNDSTSVWNFNAYTPDVVVINLFQNDSRMVEKPTHAQFKATFGNTKPGTEFIIQSYKNFIKQIRNQYPKAHIICALGSMTATATGSPWPDYIESAVKGLGDSKTHVLIFPYKNTGGHPSVEEQKVMANQLISFIEKNIQW
jgi:hypothetical protein